MAIGKIISGGQTGADRAALDFAIEYEIEHGGWVPEGRRAEDGIIPMKYSLMELPGGDYAGRTAKNVIDSDGTLIVSHGELTGGSLLTWVIAEKHGKPVLHVDMQKIIAFDAAIDIQEWIDTNKIEVLNVAGPRASKDSSIYKTTCTLLETVFHIDIIANAMPDQPKMSSGHNRSFPQNVEQAVNRLTASLSPMDKIRIASAKRKEFNGFEDFLKKQVSLNLGLDTGNRELVEDCKNIAGASDMDEKEAVKVILQELQKNLRQAGHLRIVK